MLLERIGNYEESTTHHGDGRLSSSSVALRIHTTILHRSLNQCATAAAECRWVYGLLWDDKSLCNQAVAQLHMGRILSFRLTVYRTVSVYYKQGTELEGLMCKVNG